MTSEERIQVTTDLAYKLPYMTRLFLAQRGVEWETLTPLEAQPLAAAFMTVAIELCQRVGMSMTNAQTLWWQAWDLPPEPDAAPSTPTTPQGES